MKPPVKRPPAGSPPTAKPPVAPSPAAAPAGSSPAGSSPPAKPTPVRRFSRPAAPRPGPARPELAAALVPTAAAPPTATRPLRPSAAKTADGAAKPEGSRTATTAQRTEPGRPETRAGDNGSAPPRADYGGTEGAGNEAGRPDSVRLGRARPGSTRPERAKPERPRPEAPQPETPRPDRVRLDLGRPAAMRPGAPRPGNSDGRGGEGRRDGRGGDGRRDRRHHDGRHREGRQNEGRQNDARQNEGRQNEGRYPYQDRQNADRQNADRQPEARQQEPFTAKTQDGGWQPGGRQDSGRQDGRGEGGRQGRQGGRPGRGVRHHPRRNGRQQPAPVVAPPPPAEWQKHLNRLIPRMVQREPRHARQLFYVLGPYNSHLKTWVIEFWQQELQGNGQWSVLKIANLVSTELADLDPAEQQLVRRLFESYREGRGREVGKGEIRGRMVIIPSAVFPLLLPALISTGRFGKIGADPQHQKRFEPFQWDFGGPWWLVIEGCETEPGCLTLRGRLRRGAEDLPMTREVEILPGGIFRRGNRLAEIEAAASEEWLKALQQSPEIVVPEQDVPAALTLLTKAPACPAVELDRKWQQRIGEAPPGPALRVTLRTGEYDFLPAQLLFVYGSLDVPPDDPHELLFDTSTGKIFRRARAAEREFAARLPGEFDPRGYGTLPAAGSAQLFDDLAREGWRIATTDRKVHAGGRFLARVQSGIDWFDLSGTLDFGSLSVSLPTLLQAVREGRGWVNLADGSVGLLPAGWVERWAALIDHVQNKKSLRFERTQALVLDNLLKSDHEVETDEIFGRIREKLRSFQELTPTSEPPGFVGELRSYQRLGLAWLELLAELKLSGCLADDMGLGKTIQVLAWLLRRKQQGQTHGKPSLLVVPRSLVFNWVAELTRFTPSITFVVSHGQGRQNVLEEVAGKDLLITTYGTLVRDVDKLKAHQFDVMVIDEAQAIKNRGTQAAEACSAITASLRLALTGTPVENHLGELWSIFDFLNPGLVASLPKVSAYAGRIKLPAAALAEIADTLRPLILRRKKVDVLKELPEKTELTLFCELSAEERRRYDELRVFYQASLKEKIEEVGLAKSKIWVLEALLRLRQAACHPGLLDKKSEGQSSAKVDTLLENLQQVLAEGHKAIVFSQFTSLLALVKEQLDKKGYTYEYLDGKTRDREERVNRFQNDPEISLFLISLKAGGVGLNLTAASYVFLLDPWWNPAVESQAIDRAHRIGQQQAVFAYRLIASGTVEEKILELQKEKRALADAIISEDTRVLKQLTAADLEQLLG